MIITGILYFQQASWCSQIAATTEMIYINTVDLDQIEGPNLKHELLSGPIGPSTKAKSNAHEVRAIWRADQAARKRYTG